MLVSEFVDMPLSTILDGVVFALTRAFLHMFQHELSITVQGGVAMVLSIAHAGFSVCYYNFKPGHGCPDDQETHAAVRLLANNMIEELDTVRIHRFSSLAC